MKKERKEIMKLKDINKGALLATMPCSASSLGALCPSRIPLLRGKQRVCVKHKLQSTESFINLPHLLLQLSLQQAPTAEDYLLLLITNSKHYMSTTKNNGEGGETASISCFHFLFIDTNTIQQGKVSF